VGVATSYYGSIAPESANTLNLPDRREHLWGHERLRHLLRRAGEPLQPTLERPPQLRRVLEGVPARATWRLGGGNRLRHKHNPSDYYDDVRASPRLWLRTCVPTRASAPSFGVPSASVPDYVWVTPDLWRTTGTTAPLPPLRRGFSKFVSEVTASGGVEGHGVLFVTWDESDGDDSAVVAPGRIAASGGGVTMMTLVIARVFGRGLRVRRRYNSRMRFLATGRGRLRTDRCSRRPRTPNCDVRFFKTGPSS